MCPQNDEANEFPQFTTRTEDVTQMDPSLQDLVLRAKDGLSLDPAQAVASAETGEIWVDIIAKLKNPAREVPGLDVRVTIGQIVTGRARVQDIEAIHEDGNVLSLKASKPMRPAMERSVREIHADTRTLRDHFPTQPVDGSDVIVGLVDFGCDFCHQNFRTADGKSRLLYLWDQKGGDNLPDSPTKRKPDKPNEYKYRYGREYDKQAIDRALSSADPYWELGGYTPIDKDHGTHVLDIAAGNGRATGNLGVAPGADLIFVHLGKPDYTGEKSLGGSTRLLEAVEYIFDKADELGKPAVVNLSLATNGGPHDGSTMIDQAFDKKLEGKDNRAIVICAGNVYNRSIHCTGKVTSDQPAEIEWKILSRCPVVQEMEIWYSGKDEFKVEIVEPGGKSLQPVKLGEIKSTTIGPNNEVLLVRTVHRCEDSTNGDHQIDIFLYCHEHEFMTGDWKIILHPVGDITDGTFHSWIERDNYYASCFSKRHSDPAYTLGSIATGTLPIVVGSYDAYSPGRAVSLFSSSGPTRDGRPKPDISAPGESIKAARATTQTVCQDSGTSMAAPFVTGLIALMMQVAKEQGKDLSIQEIRDMLMQTARKDPPPGGILDLRYGAGRIDCSATIASLVGETVPVHAGAASTTARRALAVPASSSRFVPLAHELAGVATGANVRLRLTLELEPLAPGRAREGRVVTSLETPTDREREIHAVTPEEYIALLESATRKLCDLNAARDDMSPLSASAISIEASIQNEVDAVAQKTGFWQPDRLFDDRGQTVFVDGVEVEAVEIPRDYLAVSTEKPELADQILWDELDFIDAQILETYVTSDAFAAAGITLPSLKRIIQGIKDVLRSTVEPKIETTAPSLSSFHKNWQGALDQLTSKAISGGSDVLSSLVPFSWDDIAHWLTVFRNKLPKGILDLPLLLQKLVRWLFKWFYEKMGAVQSKFDIGDDLVGKAGDFALNTLRTQGPKLIANALWQTRALNEQVEGEVKQAAERLGISKSARLSKKRRASLKGCLKEVENTVHDMAWEMFGIGKIAWVAGLIMPKLAVVEPGPFVELGMAAVAVAALGLVVVLGRDALHDRDDRVGRYRGIGTIARATLETLE